MIVLPYLDKAACGSSEACSALIKLMTAYLLFTEFSNVAVPLWHWHTGKKCRGIYISWHFIQIVT